MADAPFPYFGHLMAILNASLWSITVIGFKKMGDRIPPISMNLFKLVIGFISLVSTLKVLGIPLIPTAPWQHYALFCISGILGIAVADTLFFAGLNILGAGRSALMECLYSPFVIFFSFLLLGQNISWMDALGGFFILLSIPLTSKDHRKHPIGLSDFLKGVGLASSAMALMALGIVIVTPLLPKYSVFWVTALRTLAGLVALGTFSMLRSDRKKIWSIFKPQAIWKLAVPNCFLASYPSMVLWIASFTFAKANVAALLTQLSSVFTVLLAVPFLAEPLTRKKIVALVCAMVGVALIFR
ncbi:MAG: DMT family transporter [Bdellovibrionota bacterium]